MSPEIFAVISLEKAGTSKLAMDKTPRDMKK